MRARKPVKFVSMERFPMNGHAEYAHYYAQRNMRLQPLNTLDAHLVAANSPAMGSEGCPFAVFVVVV